MEELLKEANEEIIKLKEKIIKLEEEAKRLKIELGII